ncbi:MAG TPA: hypothetical protein DIT48_04725, partial [Actinobacteria bacterium]|nr:hypothetical protein [Actinomycetota bacterium]
AGAVLPFEHRQGRGPVLPPGPVLQPGGHRRGVHHPPPPGPAPRTAGRGDRGVQDQGVRRR